jgi:hypothetical protein
MRGVVRWGLCVLCTLFGLLVLLSLRFDSLSVTAGETPNRAGVMGISKPNKGTHTRYGGGDDNKPENYFNKVPGGKHWFQLQDAPQPKSRPRLIPSELNPPISSADGFVILVASNGAISRSHFKIIVTIKEALLAIGSTTDLNVMLYINWESSSSHSKTLT